MKLSYFSVDDCDDQLENLYYYYLYLLIYDDYLNYNDAWTPMAAVVRHSIDFALTVAANVDADLDDDGCYDGD